MHLHVRGAAQMMQAGALQGKLPRDCVNLPFVLKLMQLGVEGRQMLKNRVFRCGFATVPLTFIVAEEPHAQVCGQATVQFWQVFLAYPWRFIS